MWRTGVYKEPKKKLAVFSRNHWGVKTEEIMLSVDKTTERGFKKIINESIPYIDIYRSRPSRQAQRRRAKRSDGRLSGHATCYEEDSGNDSISSVGF